MKKLLILGLAVFSMQLFAASAAEQLQARLNGMKTMTANFKQVVKAKEREISRSSGNMALQRPGRFRWMTKEPMEQLVVADGKKLWIYDVDLEQVSVKKQGNSLGGTAALFLSGYDDTVAREFSVQMSTKSGKEIYDLKALSGKANFQRLKLIFSGQTLSSLEMFDQLGQHTIVDLTQVKANPKLSASLFQFTPPKGTDVVHQ